MEEEKMDKSMKCPVCGNIFKSNINKKLKCPNCNGLLCDLCGKDKAKRYLKYPNGTVWLCGNCARNEGLETVILNRKVE